MSDPHAWRPDAWQQSAPWAPPVAPPPGADPWAGVPLTGEERTWLTAAHLLPILTSWLGPLVLLLTVGERSPRVREHALESLNVEITFWLAMAAAALLTFVLVGYVLLGLLPIAALVLRLLAVGDARAGRRYRYPLCWRVVR